MTNFPVTDTEGNNCSGCDLVVVLSCCCLNHGMIIMCYGDDDSCDDAVVVFAGSCGNNDVGCSSCL